MNINIRIQQDFADLTGLPDLMDYLDYLITHRDGIDLFFSPSWWKNWTDLKNALNKFLNDWCKHRKREFKKPLDQYDFLAKVKDEQLFFTYFGKIKEKCDDSNLIIETWPMAIVLAQIRGDISYLCKNLIKCGRRHKFEIMDDNAKG